MLEVETKYNDLYELNILVVPQDVRNFMKEKAEHYKNNSQFAYENKDYATPKALQIDVNANSDEAVYLDLINNNKEFVDAINNKIKEFKINNPNITLPNCYLEGKYTFNTYHGMTDHNKFQHMLYENGKTVVDLLHDGYSKTAAWRVEIKSSFELSDFVKECHKTEILLKHILGTTDTYIYMPTNFNRPDDCYICIGIVSGFGNWKNVKINDNWEISKW